MPKGFKPSWDHPKPGQSCPISNPTASPGILSDLPQNVAQLCPLPLCLLCPTLVQPRPLPPGQLNWFLQGSPTSTLVFPPTRVILLKPKSDHITPLFIIFLKDFLSFWNELPTPYSAPGPVWWALICPSGLLSLAFSLPIIHLHLKHHTQYCLEAFTIAVPTAWNALSPDLQAADSL